MSERLPRMRGDRPPTTCRDSKAAEATPHARGSTHPQGPIRGKASGYPACAGIDLSACDQSKDDQRLPRMRGDRPLEEERLFDWPGATPHARGSTPRHVLCKCADHGYPACAGIDLSDCLDELLPSRLPRMRGDRPSQFSFFTFRLQATPHARGSTVHPAAPL